jgi:exonuclease SbcC
MNARFERLEKQQIHLQQLQQQQETMEQLKKEIVQAGKANGVFPYYHAYQLKRDAAEELEQKKEELISWISIHKKESEQLRQKAEQEAMRYERENPDLLLKQDKILESLESYDEYRSLTDALDQNRLDLKQKQEQEQKLQDKLEEGKCLIKKLNEEIDEIEAVFQNPEMLESHYHIKERAKKDLLNMKMDFEEIHGLEAKKEEVKKAAVLIAAEAESKKKEYEDYYESFIKNQALILRGELEDGKPCPVCGKIHFDADPMETIGEAIEENLNQERLKELQNASKEAEEKKRKKDSEFESVVLKKEAKKEALIQRLEEYFEDFSEYDTCWERRVAEEEKELSAQMKDLKKKMEEAHRMSEQLTQKRQLRKDLEAQKEEGEQTLLSIRKYLEALKLEIGKQETKWEHLRQQMPYKKKEQAQEALYRLEQNLKRLKTEKETAKSAYETEAQRVNEKNGELSGAEDSLKKAQKDAKESKNTLDAKLKEYGFHHIKSYQMAYKEKEVLDKMQEKKQEYDDDRKSTEIVIAELLEATKGQEKRDLAQYQEEEKQLAEKKKEFDQMFAQISTMLSNNKEAFESVKRLYQKREKIRHEKQIIERLNDTANGNLSHKHINFQTYMQRQFFKNIISNANKRLKIMSNEQFILQCRKLEDLGTGNAEVGLDLDVYSLVNQQTRDVKTLSGGESFMAALSMALGMADMIQNSYGNIHIDTMFIDEGFGSLSEETRNQAIGILNELSGGSRLVGIISHVSELKEQVETQLVITKTEKGSKHKWQI